MTIFIIKTHDEGEFVCNSAELLNTFIANYKRQNAQRLKQAGYEDLIPELTVREMDEKEYDQIPASCKSCEYFGQSN